MSYGAATATKLRCPGITGIVCGAFAMIVSLLVLLAIFTSSDATPLVTP